MWQITKLRLRITGVGGLTERGAFLATETQTWRRKSGKEEEKKSERNGQSNARNRTHRRRRAPTDDYPSE